MKVLKVPLKKIKVATYNPRKDLQPGDKEYEKIKKSMERFGYVDPLVWNEKSGNLVGGHQRLKILKSPGEKEVEVSVVNFNAADERALNIALNKTGGEWDIEGLSGLFVDLEALNYDVTITGFELSEIEELHNEVNPQEIIEDTPPEPPAKPKSKRGDIYTLGKHRVMCGDATVKEDVERLMAGEKADMVFTDAPYGVDYNNKNQFLKSIGKANHLDEDILNDELPGEAIRLLWRLVYTRALEVTKQGGSYYFCTASGDGRLLLMMQTIQEAGWQLKHTIIWIKNNFVLGRTDYKYQHEILIYGWKRGQTMTGEPSCAQRGEAGRNISAIPSKQRRNTHTKQSRQTMLYSSIITLIIIIITIKERER